MPRRVRSPRPAFDFHRQRDSALLGATRGIGAEAREVQMRGAAGRVIAEVPLAVGPAAKHKGSLRTLTMSLFARLITWLRDPRRWDPNYQVPMREDRFPVDRMGRPDLSCYTEPVGYYEEMFDAYLASFERVLSREESNLATRRSIHAQWGLIARGAESIPYAIRLLQSAVPEARAAGASTLQEVGGAPGATDALLRALKAEVDDEARTAIVEALARTGSPAALEALQRLRAETMNDADLLESIDRSIARLRKKRS